MVPRPARDLEILLQNLAHRLERSDRARPHRIGDAVIGAGPAALRPHEIIDALALHEERPLDIAGRRDLLVRLAIRERLDRGDRKSTRLNYSPQSAYRMPS